MILRLSQILAAAYFASIFCCGIIESSKEEAKENMNICPPENSEAPVHLADPSDCGKFYVCDSGTPHLKSCQLGLHFNPKVNACDYPKNAGCDKSIEVKGKDSTSGDEFDTCPSENSNDPVYLAHAEDCGKFYVCDNGTPHLESCPVGLHFNPKVNACDYPKNAGCGKSVAIRSAEKELDDLSDSCPFHINGRPLFIPHSMKCDQYFICEGGRKYPFSCSPGLYFNSKQEACDFPENSDCERRKLMQAGVPSPFCPPMDGKSPVFYRHSNNCTIYYMCGNGLAYEFTCPARLHFNLRKKVCDYEVNAKCKAVGS